MGDAETSYETLLYAVDGPIATITLNRPEPLNTIVPPMPDEVEAAVHRAIRDPEVKVIVAPRRRARLLRRLRLRRRLPPLGRAAQRRTASGTPARTSSAPPPRPSAPTQKFMSVWRSPKPVIAQVHGWCVGGGSDFALCADLVIASEDAQIGTPYSRIWGAYLSGMWIYRLGLTKAKEHALTGRPLSGRRAAEIELINEAVPFERLEATVRAARRAARLAPACPARGDEADGQPGLREHGPRLDPDPRLRPRRDHAQHPRGEALDRARRRGGRPRRSSPSAIGPFGDYSQAPPESSPNPENVIRP